MLEKKRMTRELFYKGYGVVYLPGDIKGLTDKLHLLLAEFLAGETTVMNELVYVLDALLRLKQLGSLLSTGKATMSVGWIAERQEWYPGEECCYF